LGCGNLQSFRTLQAMKNAKGRSWLLFGLLSLIWGSSFMLIKKSAEQLLGWQIGAVRTFSATLVFLPFAFVQIGWLAVILGGVRFYFNK
jgi:hypothetical protein